MLTVSGGRVEGNYSFDFFCSSRRRHTRCSRDWSSDVCSSDLTFTRFQSASNSSATTSGSVVRLVVPISERLATIHTVPSGSIPRYTLGCNVAWSAFVSCASLPPDNLRSEEHTSELQSRLQLVCRLLLEKKKHQKRHRLHTGQGLPHPPQPRLCRASALVSDCAPRGTRTGCHGGCIPRDAGGPTIPSSPI